MRIALLTDGISPYVIGGMQKHSYCLAKYFACQGIHVDLYHTPLFEKRTGAMEQLSCFSPEEKKYIRPFLVDFPKEKKLFNTLSLPGHYLRESYSYSAELYKRFQQNHEVDFIYSKGFSGWKFIEEKQNGKKLPPIGVKFHGYEMFQRSTSLREEIHRKIFFQSPAKYLSHHADVVFSYGGKITELILSLGVSRKKIIEIPSAVEKDWLAETTAPTAIRRKFIFIGRYERRKGIQELSVAIQNLLHGTSSSKNGVGEGSFEFHFVGPVPNAKHIPSKIVYYHGGISDKERIKLLIDSADVLVCPSYSEGMPNVILEAMARGLAVIATDVGAVNCLVNEDNGFLLEKCTAEEIENAMAAMIRLNAVKLLEMKKKSLEKIKKNFLWEEVSGKLIKELREYLIGNKQ